MNGKVPVTRNLIPARRRWGHHSGLYESGGKTPKPALFQMAILTNLDLIRRAPLFAMLTNTQARAVSDAIVKRRNRKGENIVEQGKKSNAVHRADRARPGHQRGWQRARGHYGHPAPRRLHW